MELDIKSYLRNETVLCTIGAIASLVLAIDFISFNGLWGDVDHYWKNINDWFDNGGIPYKDYVFEYPPFSLVIFLIPRLFSWNLESFHFAYAIFCGIAYIFTVRCILKTIDDDRVRLYAMLILILLPIFAIRFIVTRNDIFALAGMAYAAYSLKVGKPRWAYVAIAIATMIKIYPILFLLPLIAYHFSKKDYAPVLESIFVTAVVCLIIQAPFLVIDPGSSFAYLGYHSNRNIQIESVIASVMYIASALGITDLHYDHTSGSENIVGWLPDLISPFMNYILVLGILAVLILCIRRGRSMAGDRDLMRMVCIGSAVVILTFITLNKVYSAQYMIWIIGLMPIVLWCAKGERERRIGFALTIALGILSMVAARYYNGMGFTQPVFVTLEILKNAATVILLIYCAKMLFREQPSQDELPSR